MNTIRGRNVAEFVREFYAVEGRGPTADEICAALPGVTRSTLPRIVQRLMRQQRIRITPIFEPAQEARP